MNGFHFFAQQKNFTAKAQPLPHGSERISTGNPNHDKRAEAGNLYKSSDSKINNDTNTITPEKLLEKQELLRAALMQEYFG